MTIRTGDPLWSQGIVGKREKLGEAGESPSGLRCRQGGKEHPDGVGNRSRLLLPTSLSPPVRGEVVFPATVFEQSLKSLGLVIGGLLRGTLTHHRLI